jgi:hypothetical protein
MQFEVHYIICGAASGNVRTDRLVELVIDAFEQL